MLAVISPAKSMDLSPIPDFVPPASEPQFEAKAKKLAVQARKLKADGLASLMNLSDDLANLNHDRFKSFGKQDKKPALLLFSGDVYRGFDAQSLAAEDLLATNDRLRVLSGLYGLLKPLDAIEPYRLEMGTRLENPKGKNLYSFWGDTLAKQIMQDLETSEGPSVIINLASNEYWKALDTKALKAPVITMGFREYRGGKPTMISFSAKVARGMMARFMIDGRVDHPEGLKDFALDGYRFDPDLSSPEPLDLGDPAGRWTWIFSRPDPRASL
ncbi:MAG: peroxide stress protein YaaA [Alphaproteobacteria bacterium]